MNQADKKRLSIFKLFSSNWDYLKQKNLLLGFNQKYVGNYVCPVCLDHFSPKDLNQKLPNPLTLEDAPPKSLGGAQIALTCRSCNNNMGTDLDWHLKDRMNELDFKERVIGAKQTGTFILGDLKVKGEIRIDENGDTIAYNSKKHNNPKLLEEYIKRISNDKNLSPRFEPDKSKVDPKKLQIALLKSAYIILFRKFGYSFLFHPVYDRLREQLKNPTKDIYPLNCWMYGAFSEENIGVSFIMEKELESIFVLFKLKTKLKERLFAVILPLTTKPIEEVINQLIVRFSKEKSFNIQMEHYSDDYLTNMDSAKLLLGWMNKFR